MGNLFRTRTDGLGHVRNAQAMATGRAAFETAPDYPGDDEDDIGLDAKTDCVIDLIGRACRADGAACRDLLREAAAMLETLADEVEA